MKILTWNIRHGGSRNRFGNIIQSLVSTNADILVLTEYRTKNGEILRDLRQAGWDNICWAGDGDINSVLVAAKHPIEVVETPSKLKAAHRWCEITSETAKLNLVGVHVPNQGEVWDKKDFWDTLIRHSKERVNQACILIGDYNTGFIDDTEGTDFYLRDSMEALRDLGWVDAWNYQHPLEREFTWYSVKQNGFRLDHAFISPPLLHRLRDSRHVHEWRIAGYSDHSGLLVELE